MRTPRWSTAALVALALLAGPALAGCGDGDDATSSAPAPTCRGAEGPTLTIVALNMAFADRCLTVAPGTYTITFDNQDEGTGHDLHVTGDGVDVRSRLFVGPGTDELTVDLTAPGTYRYTCDPHDNMVGTIEVVAPGPASGADGPTTTAAP